MVKTVKFDLDLALKKAGGGPKRAQEIPRAMLGEKLIEQWATLEALSVQFEALQLGVDALCESDKKPIDKQIEAKINDCKRIIADALQAIQVGQEMLRIIATLSREAMGATTAKTVDHQAITIQEDIVRLQVILEFQTSSLEGFIATMREVKGAQGAIEAVLAQAPNDNGEVN